MDKTRTFTLDTPINKDFIVKVVIKTKYYNDRSYFQAPFVGIYSEGAEVTEITLQTDPRYLGQSGDHDPSLLCWPDVYGEDSQYVFGKVYFDEGKIELYFDIDPLIEGEDNIIVEFVPQGDRWDYTWAAIGDFELENDGILFFNKGRYFTEKSNSLYIPSTNINMIDSSKGVISLGDNTLGVFTYDGITYLNKTTVDIGEEKRETFSITKGQSNQILASPYSIANLANDPLFLSENGVFALKFSENIKSNERYALERSGLINSLLTKHSDLSKAKAIVWQNRYYLAIDDIVYVGDARFKTSARDQDMADTFNYEWWYWTNVPVKNWYIDSGNKLCFISTSGQLCEFTSERYDTVKTPLSDNKGNSLGYFAPVSNSGDLFQFDTTKIDLLKNGDRILRTKENYEEPTYFEISDVDKTKGTFKLKDIATGEYIRNNMTFFGWYMSSTSASDGTTITYYYHTYLFDYKNVVSEWYTPIINMGTSLYSKNLLSSTLVFEPNIEGEVKFGYLTRRKNETIYKNSALNPSNGVDFDDIDFTDFSFAVGFAVSRTLKTRVRNFNFIQFRIVSDTNKDCALNNFTITYNIGRKNKGVR